MTFDNNNEVVGLDHVEPILEAITHKYPLKMSYKPFNKDEFAVNIHPYHLRQYNRRWYVFAYSEDKKEIQNYPLDRITKLEHLSKPYIETDVDFEEYFDDIVGVTNYKNSSIERVVLKVSNKSIDYIRTKPLHGTQTELKELGTMDQTFIQLKLKINIELEMLLLSYGDAIEIIEPSWLRVKFAEITKKMSYNYKV
jgi:predicted DNA-binding transcriptional regulator YafY